MHEIQWEEGQHLEALEDMEKECFLMVDILKDVSSSDFAEHYRKDIPGFIVATKKLAERCRTERESLGLWREDELEPEEIIEELDAEFGVITKLMKSKIYPKMR